MKKIMCAVIAAVMMMCSAVSADTTVFYHEDSQYTVLIPETIIADGTQYTFTAPVMDLCDGDRVDVTIGNIDMAGSIHMSTSTNKDMIAEFFNESGKLMPGQTVATFRNGMTEAGMIYATPFSTEGAGDYYGSVVFNINRVHEGEGDVIIG